MKLKNKYRWKVYVHITPVGKYYVGMTSQTLLERWKNGKGYGNNLHFTNAINKYGWDNIESELISSGNTREEAMNFEILLISKLRSNEQDYGYNKSTGGESRSGIVVPQEVRDRISATLKSNDDREFTTKATNQYSLDGELIKKWESVVQASRALGIHQGGIGMCSRGETMTSGGFIWRYLDSDRIIDFNKVKDTYLPHSVGVKQYDFQGNLLGEWDTMMDASRETGVCNKSISACCVGVVVASNGYIWRHSNDDSTIDFEQIRKSHQPRTRDVKLYDLENNLIGQWESYKSLGKYLGVSPESISTNIRMGCKTFMRKYRLERVEVWI